MKNVIRSTKRTSSKASKVLNGKTSSKTTKSLAGSVLSNRRKNSK